MPEKYLDVVSVVEEDMLDVEELKLDKKESGDSGRGDDTAEAEVAEVAEAVVAEDDMVEVATVEEVEAEAVEAEEVKLQQKRAGEKKDKKKKPMALPRLTLPDQSFLLSKKAIIFPVIALLLLLYVFGQYLNPDNYTNPSGASLDTLRLVLVGVEIFFIAILGMAYIASLPVEEETGIEVEVRQQVNLVYQHHVGFDKHQRIFLRFVITLRRAQEYYLLVFAKGKFGRTNEITYIFYEEQVGFFQGQSIQRRLGHAGIKVAATGNVYLDYRHSLLVYLFGIKAGGNVALNDGNPGF